MIINDILQGLRVKDISGADHSNVITLSPKMTVLDAVRVLKDNKIGIVIVCDSDGGLVGVLSERDVVHGLATHGDDALRMEIGSLMTREVETCTPSDPPHVVMNRMATGRFRHMPVLEDGTLKTVISNRDILKHYSKKADPKDLAELIAKLPWV